jgi:hypothetical protein
MRESELLKFLRPHLFVCITPFLLKVLLIWLRSRYGPVPVLTETLFNFDRLASTQSDSCFGGNGSRPPSEM